MFLCHHREGNDIVSWHCSKNGCRNGCVRVVEKKNQKQNQSSATLLKKKGFHLYENVCHGQHVDERYYIHTFWRNDPFFFWRVTILPPTQAPTLLFHRCPQRAWWISCGVTHVHRQPTRLHLQFPLTRWFAHGSEDSFTPGQSGLGVFENVESKCVRICGSSSACSGLKATSLE